jgi:cysteine synthase A
MPAIGNTPLIKLEKLSEPGCAEIYVKYEGGNPTGSMKDRMALSMIEGAERRGELKPGGTVVEYTGGSTGSSLAMVCANKGYRARFVSSDAFAEEKLQTMRAFGADLEIIPSGNGLITARLINTLIARAKELSQAPNTFWTDQFNNVDNRNA